MSKLNLITNWKETFLIAPGSSPGSPGDEDWAGLRAFYADSSVSQSVCQQNLFLDAIYDHILGMRFAD